MANPQKGIIGLIITLTVKDQAGAVVDISTATSTKNIVFEKPDGTTVTKAASFSSNGIDGKIKYTTQSGDLDQAGFWEAQADLVMTGFTGRSSKTKFVVDSNLG